MKLIHSAIFFAAAAAVLEVFTAGIRAQSTRRTRLALMVALGESAVFVANGFRCPLTEIVRRASGESVRVTDIFLPRWLADRIPYIFGPPLAIGVVGLLIDWRRRAFLDGQRQRALERGAGR